MRYENNALLREYLHRGAAGAHREYADQPSFDFDATAFADALNTVRAQHPHLSEPQAEARAAFRLLTSTAPLEKVSATSQSLQLVLPQRPRRAQTYLASEHLERIAPDAWRYAKLIWAIALLLLALTAVILLTERSAHGATPPGNADVRIGVFSEPLHFRVPHPSSSRVRVLSASAAHNSTPHARTARAIPTPSGGSPTRAKIPRANIVRVADLTRSLRIAPPALLPQISGGGSIAARLQFLNGSNLWSSVSAANPLPITCISGCSGSGGGGSAVLSGQQAVTASAVALATNTTKTVCIKALAANTINIYVGATGVTTTTGMELAPGNAYCVPATNTNLFYVIASTTGANVLWVASN